MNSLVGLENSLFAGSRSWTLNLAPATSRDPALHEGYPTKTFQKKSFAAASYSASICSNLAIIVPPPHLGFLWKNLFLIPAVLAFFNWYGFARLHS